MSEKYDTEKILTDLTGKVKGETRFSEHDQILYSTDASMFKIKPTGVIIPASTADVVTVVKYCHKNKIPFTARGTGSGLAGGAINKGLIFDFRKLMKNIVEINNKEGWVRVQPGVILTPLNTALKPYGKFFAPNPSSADYCTIGGMVGNNASGGKSVKYGATKQYIKEMELVLHNGDVVRTKIFKEDDPKFKALLIEKSEWGRINREVYKLCRSNAGTITEHTPDVVKNCSGYNLKEALKDGVFDINKVICGSEGTLAVVTEVKLGIVPIPKAKQSAMLFFNTLEDAGKGVNVILEFGPSTCEIMAEDFISLVKADRPEVATFMPEKAGTALLLEFEGQRIEEVSGQMQNCLGKLTSEGLLLDSKVATEASDQAMLWAMRKAALPIIYNRPGLKMPVTFVEDCTINPSKLPVYIKGIMEIFEKHGVDATAYGHAGDGNIHTRPLMNLRKKEDVDKLIPIATDVYALARSLDATYSGEHGDGRLRAQFLPELFGPLWEVFKNLKLIWDPDNIVNPDRIINNEKNPLITNQRMGGGNYPLRKTNTLIDIEEVRANLEKCHGCGQCLTFCPILKIEDDEKAAPRGKINIARAVLYGDLPIGKALTQKEMKEIIDLCYNCKTCKVKCPTHVDTGLVLQHLLANYFENAGASFGLKMISDAKMLGTMGVRFNPISNAVVRSGIARAMMEKMPGVARERLIQPFAKTPLRKKMKEGVSGKKRKIAYFTGCYANYYEAEDGYAFLAIMKHLDYEVIFPDQECCGLPRFPIGDYKSARKSIQYNVESLKKVVDDGYTIVTACPSCYSMINHEMLDVIRDSPILQDAKKVAANIHEATDFLWHLVESGELTGFSKMDMKIAYKNPCHANERGIDQSAIKLLESIPGVKVVLNNDTCCGMVGTWGMKKKNFENSLIIANDLKLDVEKSGADTMSTSCGGCGMQFHQVTGREIVHPLAIVAKALGLKL